MAESTVIKLNLMNCCHMIFTRPDFHLIKSNQAGSRRWYASFDDGRANNSATEIAFCATNLVSQNCVFRLFILSGVFYNPPPPPPPPSPPGTKLAMTCDTFIDTGMQRQLNLQVNSTLCQPRRRHQRQ